jgi:hypothetical protein
MADGEQVVAESVSGATNNVGIWRDVACVASITPGEPALVYFAVSDLWIFGVFLGF